MTLRRLGRTDMTIEPLIFGGNVLGWTLEEGEAFKVLDAFVDAGFAAVDTSDSYGKGKSETILGNWMKARGNRNKVLVFTKVGSDMGQGHRDLSSGWITQEVEASLRRLGTDRIDLYQSHWPDPQTPQEETLEAFDRLIRTGKVRWIGSSNQDDKLLGEALSVSRSRGLARYETVQNKFNLVDREAFEGPVQDVCVREEISGIGYSSLASGFLSGKYRSAEDAVKSPRGKGVVDRYLNDRSKRVLAAVEAVARRRNTTPAAIAIAWIVAQPGVGGAIASATSPDQLSSLTEGARLSLSSDDLHQLTDAGR
ncbi:MAG TPA: aldo/keto reductase [Devosia sp.]|nr:aldo/keto reductase [Devosia sp.]